MTNTRRKNALDEVRHPVQNRIRYQRRKQEEKEADKLVRETLRKKPDANSFPEIP